MRRPNPTPFSKGDPQLTGLVQKVELLIRGGRTY